MKRALLIAVVLTGTAALAQAQTFGAWGGGETDTCNGYSVSVASAFPPTSFGAEATVAGCYAGMSVRDDSPAAERRYRARFYFNTNTYDPGTTTGVTRRSQFLLAQQEATNFRILAVVLRRLANQGAYQILARARRDDATRSDFLSANLTAGWHYVECDVLLATGAATNDGHFQCWLDGTSFGNDIAVQNFYGGGGVDFARFGLMKTVVGSAGTAYLDEFESRRQTFIGALP